ncbi:MAG: PilN domain-containing protein [Solirubrobacteraceae bacterium]
MKAVNLIPMDSRRGAGAPDRSGGAVYGVLGVLGVLAVIAVMYGLTTRSLNTQEQELAQLTADSATGVEAAAALEPYVRFGQIADEREQTVITIADQRFDWGLAMREIARVLPGNVDLVSLDGTRQGVTAAAGSDPAAAAVGAPQITMTGCATSQASVALLMARLRAMQGVDRVRLESSSKGGAAGAGASSGGDCRGGDEEKPQFTLAVIFRTDDTAASAQAGSTAAPAAQSGESAPEEGSS